MSDVEEVDWPRASCFDFMIDRPSGWHVEDEGGVLQRLRQLDEIVDGFVEAKLSAG